tara:strand:- start:69762 stop:70157 length:396 start_codon:yes stop_codon:yes gene_type:complete
MKKAAFRQKSAKDPLLVCKSALEDMKARDVKVVSLEKRKTYTDNLIIATGTSNTHVQAIADRVAEYLIKSGHIIDGIEGSPNNQWVIVDAGDVVVHIFNEETRKLYNIEKLYIDFDDDGDDTPDMHHSFAG